MDSIRVLSCRLVTLVHFKIRISFITCKFKIVKVNSKITILGTRTSFDHGTTLSGSATTEYIPIAKYAIGLNKKVDLQNARIKFDATEAMKPSGVDENPLGNAYSQIYEQVGFAVEVPQKFYIII